MKPNALLDPPAFDGIATEVSETFGDDAPHLVFDVDAHPYACPIGKILHLVRCGDAYLRLSPAGAPFWEAGRLVTEGDEEGIPVASLRALWGLSPLTEAASRERQAILIVSLAGRQHALLVDGCRCVLSHLPQGLARFRLPSALQRARGRAFKLATPWRQSLLVVLEVDELLASAPGGAPQPVPGAAECQ